MTKGWPSWAKVFPALAASVWLFVAGAGCSDFDAEDPLPSDAVVITNDFGGNDRDLYVALGDSITWGSQPDAAPSYPERLSLLLDRTVVNEGIRGEQSQDGLDRVDVLLAARKPGFLLIIFGANDVFHDTPRRDTITNLLQIAQRARNNGTVPVLGTTLPILVEGHDEWTRAVSALNGQIRELAAREDILLVDLEDIFTADPDVLLRPDCVHPSSAGNAAIARAFHDLLCRIVVEER